MWGTAGTEADMKMVAACVALLHCAPEAHFERLPLLWAGRCTSKACNVTQLMRSANSCCLHCAGCMMMKGTFLTSGPGRQYLCLGFRTWAAIGVELAEHVVDGQARSAVKGVCLCVCCF